jgi:hypothetical protein
MSSYNLDIRGSTEAVTAAAPSMLEGSPASLGRNGVNINVLTDLYTARPPVGHIAQILDEDVTSVDL